MKKLLASCLVLAVSCGFSYAESGSGCGLGKMIWDGQSGRLAHISAATTNGTSGNQTLGITSGTLGCKPDSTVMNVDEQKMFVVDNAEYLFDDISKGSGNYILAYSEVMGCKSSSFNYFSKKMQNNHESIFKNGLEEQTILKATKDIIINDSSLKENCSG